MRWRKGRKVFDLWPIHKDGWCRQCTGGVDYRHCPRCKGSGKEEAPPKCPHCGEGCPSSGCFYLQDD